ncbi:hypothetical protein D3C85_801640 [compost metagenome]
MMLRMPTSTAATSTRTCLGRLPSAFFACTWTLSGCLGRIFSGAVRVSASLRGARSSGRCSRPTARLGVTLALRSPGRITRALT